LNYNNFVDIKADQETSSTKVQINFDKEIAKIIDKVEKGVVKWKI